MRPGLFTLVLTTFGLILGNTRSISRSQTTPPATPLRTYRFDNGQWFDGKTFRSQTFYSVNGKLTRHAPPKVDETLDLKGGYVVPPFGDAHCHHFEGTFNIAPLTTAYLEDGIFYAHTMANSWRGAQEVARQVNIPTGIDVRYAHGCLTGSHSHPIPVYEGMALGYYTPRDQYAHLEEIFRSHKRDNDCYYIVDTQEDLDTKWPRILANKPDIIKVILLHCENYAQRKKSTGYGEGIDPQLLPEIVRRAHAAGLRVAAHVDSAADYRTALKSGVDVMAHLCGYYMAPSDDIQTYQLTPADAAETAKRRVTVIPTANRLDIIDAGPNRERARANMIRNLRLLKNAGVHFGIGADIYGTDSLKEALYLNDLDVWSPLELLKIWCENTPCLIFPGRKIGQLKEGFEASFLVLGKNPLENFTRVQLIRLRFKQGVLLPS